MNSDCVNSDSGANGVPPTLEAPVDPGTWAWEGLLLWPHWPVVSLSSCAVFACVIVPVNLHLTDVVSFPDGQLGHVDGFLM